MKVLCIGSSGRTKTIEVENASEYYPGSGIVVLDDQVYVISTTGKERDVFRLGLNCIDVVGPPFTVLLGEDSDIGLHAGIVNAYVIQAARIIALAVIALIVGLIILKTRQQRD